MVVEARRLGRVPLCDNMERWSWPVICALFNAQHVPGELSRTLLMVFRNDGHSMMCGKISSPYALMPLGSSNILGDQGRTLRISVLAAGSSELPLGRSSDRTREGHLGAWAELVPVDCEKDGFPFS